MNPFLIALAALLGFLACAAYVASLFVDAPLRDGHERLVESGERAVDGERMAS